VSGPSRDAIWRGGLTPEQSGRLKSWLDAHPEERATWEEEVALTRLLTRLPESQAPSNMMARVLQAIDAPAPVSKCVPNAFGLGWLKRVGWVPRLAGVAVLVVAASIGHHQYRVAQQRADLARGVVEVSELATVVPSVEALQDFTAIRNLEVAAVPDEELLALLQ